MSAPPRHSIIRCSTHRTHWADDCEVCAMCCTAIDLRNNAGRETLLDTIEELREQRAAMYAATVNPRRNAARALKVLRGEDVGGISAEDFLSNVVRDLEHVSALYHEYTRL